VRRGRGWQYEHPGEDGGPLDIDMVLPSPAAAASSRRSRFLVVPTVTILLPAVVGHPVQVPPTFPISLFTTINYLYSNGHKVTVTTGKVTDADIMSLE
jgi:hypothetical protein